MVHYNNKKYYIDVVEAKPGNAISVIETDCEVDFAPPLDYVEPSREEYAAMSAQPTPMEEGRVCEIRLGRLDWQE